MNDPSLFLRFAEPFEPSEIRWKPQSVKGDRALAICYIDARCVMDRLDEVVGVGNWETSHREIPDGIVCKLRVRIGEHWCEHEDVGSYSEQPDDGDKLKAAFSDALKRVAVRIGIGRYLYRLPHQWCDYDPVKRQFRKQPQLPTWAMPKHAAERDAPPGQAPTVGRMTDAEKLTREEGVHSWRTRLAAIEDTADHDERLALFNAAFEDYKGLSRVGQLRDPVWAMMCKVAKAQGWRCDRQAGVFVVHDDSLAGVE